MTDQSADRIRPAVAAVTAIRPKIAQIDIGDGFAVASAELPHTPPSGGDFQLTVTINKVVSNTVLLPIQKGPLR